MASTPGQFEMTLRPNELLAGKVRLVPSAPKFTGASEWQKVLDLCRQRFAQETTPYPFLADLLAWNPIVGSVYVVGGAIRDILIEVLHGTQSPTHDVDIVVDTQAPNEAIVELVGRVALAAERRYECKRTSFGGVHAEYSAHASPMDDERFPDFDVWRLADSYQVRALNVPARIEEVVARAGMPLGAIAYGIENGEIIDGGCGHAVAARQIDFQDRLYRTHSQIAKALELESRLGFQFSEQAVKVMRTAKSPAADREIGSYLRRHHRPPEAQALLGRWASITAGEGARGAGP